MTHGIAAPWKPKIGDSAIDLNQTVRFARGSSKLKSESLEVTLDD